mgnify:FL=1
MPVAVRRAVGRLTGSPLDGIATGIPPTALTAGVEALAAAGIGVPPAATVEVGAVARFARTAADRDPRGVRPSFGDWAFGDVAEALPAVPSEMSFCGAPVSATATAVPPTIEAPRPSVTAAAPNQVYGVTRRCFDTEMPLQFGTKAT